MNEFFIILGLNLLNGIFTLVEIALIPVLKSSFTADAKRKSQSAQSVLDLVSPPNRFLSAVQTVIP